MLLPERRERIMNILKEKHTVTVGELSRTLFISETSVRRDLTFLERKGLLHKTYGGAVLLTHENEVLSLSARQETEKNAKLLIAQKAIELIRGGDVLYLDSSSTVLCMAPYLGKFDSLTVITNGAKIALALAEHPNIRVYSTGGLLSPNIFSYNGSMALQAIRGMHADKAFISPKAIDKTLGAFCAGEEETAIRRAMMERAQSTILLCAARKANCRASFHLCAWDAVDTVVCDTSLDAEWQACLAQAHTQLL